MTPYDIDLRPDPQCKGGVEHAEETTQTRRAVSGGHVRRALRHGIEQRHGRAAVHDARGEPPRHRPAGRRLCCPHQQFLKEAESEADVVGVASDVVDAPVAPAAPAAHVPERERRVVAVSSRRVGGGEDVVDRVDEDTGANVVVDGTVALLRRRWRRVEHFVEHVGHALAAGGVVDDVAAAERKGVDSIWRMAEGGGGEVRWGRRGVLGEGGGDLFKVVAEYVGGRRRQRREAGADEHEEQGDSEDDAHHG